METTINQENMSALKRRLRNLIEISGGLDVMQTLRDIKAEPELLDTLKQIPTGDAKYRHFELKPDDALNISEALIKELQHWGGFEDVWHDMLPQSQDEIRTAFARLLRKHVNQVARGVK